jgi:signal transduction histidine kinase
VKKGLLIIFLLLIAVAVFLITWLSYSAYQREQDTAADQYRMLAGKQLEEIDRLTLAYLQNIETMLLDFNDAAELDANQLRSLTRKSRFIKQIFLISDDKKFIFPPEAGEISTGEREFLTTAAELELPQVLVSRSKESTQDRQFEKGWFNWFEGEGINFIFWQFGKQNILVGIVLDRIALISGIISILPESDILPSGDLSNRITLTDARGKILYQWGTYVPRDGETPVTGIPLSYPLGAWHLDTYMDTDIESGSPFGARYLSLFSGILALIVVIAFMVFYLYRENKKAVRDALQKVSFVNQISHEFKTPLTNIRLFAELLEQGISGQKNLEHLEVIITESGRLGRMINNVLTFSRDERNSLTLSPEKTNIDQVIQKVVDSFQPLLSAKSFKINVHCDAPGEIIIDSDCFEQILNNLIGNVEKYAAAGGYIEIRSSQDDRVTSVWVADKGPGIPAGERHNVFKPFYRIDNSLTEGVSGTGIGLAIARKLAIAIGGALVLENTDNGAVFRLDIFNTGEGGPE